MPRKQRNFQLEATLRKEIGGRLKKKWGNFHQEGECWLVFPAKGRKVLCKYSSCYRKNPRWFWGVSHSDWSAWRSNDFIALMLEDYYEGYSVILLNSKELKTLIEGATNPNINKQRQINMRVYENGDFHFQENKRFDIEKRMKHLATKKLAI